MRTTGPTPSIASLVASWLSLTGWVVSACAARADALIDAGQQSMKDAVLDMGCPIREPIATGAPLPPLNPDAFATAMQERVTESLKQMAELINEEPHGCLESVTRDRVQTLFRDLAQQTLAVALEMRVSTAEAERGEEDATSWVRKYRRMLASEGHWPPPKQSEETSSEESGHGEEA